jgi:hypothetical protein
MPSRLYDEITLISTAAEFGHVNKYFVFRVYDLGRLLHAQGDGLPFTIGQSEQI